MDLPLGSEGLQGSDGSHNRRITVTVLIILKLLVTNTITVDNVERSRTTEDRNEGTKGPDFSEPKFLYWDTKS